MSGDMRVYVGTYTDSILFGSGEEIRAEGEGIYQLRVSEEGEMEIVSIEKGIHNPSFLCSSADGRFLYAVNELKSSEGVEGGGVSAFAVDERTGALELLNRRPSGGLDPCHVRLHPSGRFLIASNYSSGTVSVFPIGPDGSLGEAVERIQHRGSSVNKERQEAPHAHSTIFDSSGGLMFAADLGIDRVVAYRFDPDSGRLTAVEGGGLQSKPGRGPRHMAFTSDHSSFYVVNELDSSVTSCRYSAATGEMVEIETVSTLPAGFSGESACAEVTLHPSGNFLYVSNRGHDTIAVFRCDAASGRISLVSHTPSGGGTPRHFALSPDGRIMIVANQTTDTLASFRVDSISGALEPTNRQIRVGTPSCICFHPT